MIRTKRIYDPPSPEDGYRLLIMRLWPRGVRKAAVDGWEKDLGPSRELLTSFRAGKLGLGRPRRPLSRGDVGQGGTAGALPRPGPPGNPHPSLLLPG